MHCSSVSAVLTSLNFCILFILLILVKGFLFILLILKVFKITCFSCTWLAPPRLATCGVNYRTSYIFFVYVIIIKLLLLLL